MAHSLSGQAGVGALERPAAPGASQANSGRSELQLLLRGATRASHWPLFIAHSFHWTALRGGARRFVRRPGPLPPPPPPLPGCPPRLPPGWDPLQASHPARPGSQSGNFRPLDILDSPTRCLPPSGKLRQGGHPAVRDAQACLHHDFCLPSARQSPRCSQRGARRERPGLPQQVLPPPKPLPSPAGPSWPQASDLPQGARRHLPGHLGAEGGRSLDAAQPGGTLGRLTLGSSQGILGIPARDPPPPQTRPLLVDAGTHGLERLLGSAQPLGLGPLCRRQIHLPTPHPKGRTWRL